MNKQAAVKLIARNEAALSVLSTRADAIAAVLAGIQRHCDGLQNVLSDLVSELSGTFVDLNWNSKLFRPLVSGSRTVWLVIAPDYSGADRSVVSYRDLFFEKAVGLINKQTDTVICLGADAVDLAVRQGYQIAFSDSDDFLDAKTIAGLGGFLSRLVLDMALDKEFARASMLYLGPQQSVKHGLLPFEEYEGVMDELSRAKPERSLVYPDTGRFVFDGTAVFVNLAISVALARASVFAQTARYQGLLKTKDKVRGEQRRLIRSISALKGMSLQDEQNSISTQRRMQGLS